MPDNPSPRLEVRGICRYFGSLTALDDITIPIEAGAVTCLLGDNGAGKSTLIKIMSGLERPDKGAVLVDGVPRRFSSPRDAFDLGIATVYQDLAILPDMSVARNFVLGMEPRKSVFGLKFLDMAEAAEVAVRELARIGITVRDPNQAVGTMSGGERQSLAIARAEYRGAKVLILDEPTAALGVKEAAIVLRHILGARTRGLAVVFITHNVRHALLVGDRYAILNRGRLEGIFDRADVSEGRLATLMGGGEEFEELKRDLGAQGSADLMSGSI